VAPDASDRSGGRYGQGRLRAPFLLPTEVAAQRSENDRASVLTRGTQGGP